MGAENLVLIEGAEAFGKGEFENVVMEEGSLVLEQSAGRHVFCGCYTARPQRFAPFRHLVASWNADTPEGTVVEVQARVCCQGKWSRWLSFGRWSPFIKRSSFSERGTLADMETDTLVVQEQKGAETAQLRAYLYTNGESASPRLRLLAATVRPLRWEKQEGRPVQRKLYLPAYSQLVRDPAIAHDICSPVTVAALINRWGEDALPEEVARACYDAEYQGYGNWAFSMAVAGSYGYRAYVAYLDLAGLREEIRRGYSVGVSVRYSNDPETAAKEKLPYLEGAPGTTHGHLMAVHGFEKKDEVEYVLASDSAAASDQTAQRSYRLDQFLQAWHGNVAYIVHPLRGGGRDRPQRLQTQLRPTETPGEYLFEYKNKPLPLPADFLSGPEGGQGGTLACTVQSEVAYATTAHKQFHYLAATDAGGFKLEGGALEASQRVTVYAVGPDGHMLVAEKRS